MIRRPRRIRWLPPFLVGFCAAGAAEIAVGLLLYAGPGLMRSLTTVLAVEAGALGLGLFTAPRRRPDLTDAVRRRWFTVLTAFVAATVFTALWSLIPTMGTAPLGQGVGLAFMAALPLYATGGVLGGMGTVEAAGGAGGRARVGAMAAMGAAGGFAATGLALPYALTPASLLLGCIVLLSAGGLIFSSVLDGWLQVREKARTAAPTGVVVVEERVLLAREDGGRFLLEDGQVRGWSMARPQAGDPWEVALVRAVSGGPMGARRVLHVGGGASAAPRTLVREHADLRVQVVEVSDAVVALAREHLGTELEAEPDGRIELRVGHPDDVVRPSDGIFDVLLVDTSGLASLGGWSGLSDHTRRALLGRVGERGFVAFGPHASGAASLSEDWVTARYGRALPWEVRELLVPDGERETVVLGRRSTTEGLLPGIEGFRRMGEGLP